MAVSKTTQLSQLCGMGLPSSPCDPILPPRDFRNEHLPGPEAANKEPGTVTVLNSTSSSLMVSCTGRALKEEKETTGHGGKGLRKERKDSITRPTVALHPHVFDSWVLQKPTWHNQQSSLPPVEAASHTWVDTGEWGTNGRQYEARTLKRSLPSGLSAPLLGTILSHNPKDKDSHTVTVH